MTWTADDLSALREGWDFEAKKAGGRDGQGEVPQAFWPTYSAMANAQGGKVVLGVKERADATFAVHGLAEPDKVERELWDQLANPQKTNVNVLSRSDVHQETIDGKTVLIVDVPRARRKEKPVYVNGDLWGGTYLRIHEGDRHADRERIRRMIADADFDSRDERILEGFSLDDLDAEIIRGYRNIFVSRRPDHPWLPLDTETFLARLGAFGLDRERGQRGLTAAGLLMFGRFETIRDAFPNYFPDYQERAAETDAIEWTDRIFPDGTWTGNVFEFYRRVILKLTADLKVPFQLDADMVRRDETHVHEAVREALINTLIHADYEGRISILVFKTPTGFEFRNPGGLRLPPEEVRVGGLSDCRNRTLQKMFLMLGLGEYAGSGYSRILRAWQEQHWAIPSLRENVEVDTTTLSLPIESSVQSSHSDGNPSHSDGDPSHSDGDPSHSDGDPSHSDDDPILVVTKKRRASESEIVAAILHVCRADFRTSRQIAKSLNRAHGTIVKNYLSKMLRERLLELKYPEAPYRPGQAYRTAKRSDRRTISST